MTVGILIPSLNRPHLLKGLVENIHATAGHDHKLHFVVSDPESIAVLTELGEHFVTDDGGTVIERVNRLFDETDEPLFYYCGDDDIHYDGWLAKMVALLTSDVAMVVSSDYSTTLIRRHYITQRSGCADVPGVVLFPGYHHNFSEVELICTAYDRNVVAWCDEPTIEHVRHLDGQAPYDDTYKRGDDTWGADETTWNSRGNLWHGKIYWIDRAK
jgi:hypothetical protein